VTRPAIGNPKSAIGNKESGPPYNSARCRREGSDSVFNLRERGIEFSPVGGEARIGEDFIIARAK